MINKEDYEEPRCPFCNLNEIKRIPLKRITEKLDNYFYREDYAGAENLLSYWVREADTIYDNQGKLSLFNEYVGMYRKLGKKEECIKYINSCVELVSKSEFDGLEIKGTTFLNIATGFKACGKLEDAITYYKKAEEEYNKTLKEDDERFSALYNNSALAYGENGELEKSEMLFLKALECLNKNKHTESEIAITYCNLLDLYEYMGKTEKVKECLLKAKESFESPSAIKDYNYAYALEKCAPVFLKYGEKEYSQIMSERAKKIYEGN